MHPPYNPDLILPPVTLGIFSSKLKELAGRQFAKVQDISKAYVISELNAIPVSVYQYALQMRQRRLEICVASGGMYSEGL